MMSTADVRRHFSVDPQRETAQEVDIGFGRAGILVAIQNKPGPHHTRQGCSGPVCDRPSAFRPVKTAFKAPGVSFDGTERAGMRSDGRKQDRNSADGCGEDRALDRYRYDRICLWIPGSDSVDLVLGSVWIIDPPIAVSGSSIEILDPPSG